MDRTVIQIPQYLQQIHKSSVISMDWSGMSGKTFFISGASGMICSYLIDVLMYRNRTLKSEIRVIAPVRNMDLAKNRFFSYLNDPCFRLYLQDVNEPIRCEDSCDYIIHAASNTHPIQYASDPIGTMTSNIVGTKNMLDFAVKQKNCRFAFLSSVEIYGENRGDTDKFNEGYCGFIDCNTVRACYPEGKRAGESLCQAYIATNAVDAVIPRISRTYGPTQRVSDSKAIAQLIKNAVNNEDIVLKSAGTQLYSYTYVADAVSALLYIIRYGERGEAYNIASRDSDVMLKELAVMLAKLAGTKVVFDLPNKIEAKGFSKATKALLDTEKLRKLGWNSLYEMHTGLADTLNILRAMKRE